MAKESCSEEVKASLRTLWVESWMKQGSTAYSFEEGCVSQKELQVQGTRGGNVFGVFEIKQGGYHEWRRSRKWRQRITERGQITWGFEGLGFCSERWEAIGFKKRSKVIWLAVLKRRVEARRLVRLLRYSWWEWWKLWNRVIVVRGQIWGDISR